MAKHHILSVNFDFPGDEAEYVDFGSNQSLLDADIVVFQPSLGEVKSTYVQNGLPLWTDTDSRYIRQKLRHWREELLAAYRVGKTIFIILVTPETGLYWDSEVLSSYDALPFSITTKSVSGRQITPTKDIGFLSSYWEQFGNEMHYQTSIEGPFTNTLLKTKVGERIVGAAIRHNQAAFILVPPIVYDKVANATYYKNGKVDSWTQGGVQLGKRLSGALVAVAKALRSEGEATPPPEWTANATYQMPEEPALQGKIQEAAAEVERLQAEKARLEGELDAVGGLRRLLYEQGKPLEYAILDALRLFGFDAEPFMDAQSEFDAVFISPEGRFLGEAEGKDKSAVNVDKYRQLMHNIQEDFAREEVTERAKGILFGNAHRLAPLAERIETFTTKCLQSAEHDRVALVRTWDLFAPARYLKANPDEAYARQCRQAFIDGAGSIVSFPAPPQVI